LGARASLSPLVVSDTVARCSNWPAHRRRLGRKCPAAAPSLHQILASKWKGYRGLTSQFLDAFRQRPPPAQFQIEPRDPQPMPKHKGVDCTGELRRDILELRVPSAGGATIVSHDGYSVVRPLSIRRVLHTSTSSPVGADRDRKVEPDVFRLLPEATHRLFHRRQPSLHVRQLLFRGG
jgi:hypothetical protein